HAEASLAAVPGQVGARLADLAAAARAVVTSEPGASSALVRAPRRLRDTFAAADLPFYLATQRVEVDGHPLVLVSSYRIERVVRYRGEGRVHRALRLRRLDRLAHRYTVLGFTGPSMGEALVLLDPVDRQFDELAPALAGGTPDLLARTGAASPWRIRFDDRAGAIVRDDLAGLAPAEQRA